LSFRVNIEMYSSYLNLFNGGVVPLLFERNRDGDVPDWLGTS
jgi:hypothetical protein